MNKDTILKEITKSAVREIFRYIIKIDVEEFEFLDIEFAKIEQRKADILVKAKQKIIHVEFQTANDASMLYRMLRYYAEIIHRFPKSEIFQYVLYIGNAPLRMQKSLQKHNIKYNYDIIDIKQLHCGDFLQVDKPEALIMAILCNFDSHEPREVIRTILSRLLALSPDANSFRKYMLMLEELSTSRDLKAIIKEEEMGLMHTRWEDLPSYEIGLEKGIEKGIEKGKIEGKIEAAKLMLKEFHLKAEDVAKKLDIPLELLLKHL